MPHPAGSAGLDPPSRLPPEKIPLAEASFPYPGGCRPALAAALLVDKNNTSILNNSLMKRILLLAAAAILMTAPSCMKSNMPEPGRTNTSCESEFNGMPDSDQNMSKKPAAKKPANE